jgi:hypothetical protein
MLSRSQRSSFAPLACLAALALAGCGGRPDGAPATGGTPDGGAKQSSLTYWNDVAPILYDKCVKCHQPGGIGPFRLDTYENAKAMALAVTTVTSAGYMPPYLVTHDGNCGNFDDGETLSAAQIATIKEWAEADKKEGTPRTITPPAIPHIDGGKEFKTPMLAPRPQGGELAKFDEYRCFPVATNLESDTYITGYEVLPGNASIVHHVVGFLIDPAKMTASGKTNAEVMKALDENDPKDPDRVGWPCFGLAGEGVEIDAVPTVWAPGQGPINYPQGIGVPMKKTHQLVIQLHYNLADPKLQGMTDSTTVRYRFADKVDRKGVFILKDGFLDTLRSPTPATLAPGQKSVKYSWQKSVGELGLSPLLPYVDLVAVMPHMHERGHKKQIDILDGNGGSSCAAKVEDWRFAWQKFYFYKAPPRLTSKHEFKLTCDYDTSADTAPVLPGWGTRNEMCIAILMFALPAGI